MALDLANYEKIVGKSVSHFWKSRGGSPEDNRLAVVGGKNLEGLGNLIEELAVKNGLSKNEIKIGKGQIVLPGFFRSTKQWDLLVIHKEKLVAAFEFKSQVGPSFGNNFNNRSEEVLGSATDIWTAAREGIFGKKPDIFLGYMMFLEDCPAVRVPVKSSVPHFKVFPEFVNASYATRYKLLCEKLISERLYQGAAVIMSSRAQGLKGKYEEYYLKDFVANFAAHIAKVAATTTKTKKT